MPEILKQWDVLVIGGGLAGSAAAIQLAQHGRRVLLVEKTPAAHDKVCGEFISCEAQYYLAALGFDLLYLGAKPIGRIRLARGNKVATTRLPFAGLSLSRRVLDEAMLLFAAHNGATVQRGVSVSGLARENGRWRVELAGSDCVFTDTVFLATGKHDIRGWARKGTQNEFVGFKMHFTLARPQLEKLADHVEMVLFDGGYAGLESVEDGKANLCLIVTKSRLAACGKNWEQLLAAILQNAPLLAERLAEARPCWPNPLAIFGLPYGFVHRDKTDAPSQLYRLGDQMAVIPSFSGDGMAIALHTAFLAVDDYLHRDASAYHRRARFELLPQIRLAAWLSKLVEFPLAQTCVMSACCRMPALMTAIAARTRLSVVRGDATDKRLGS